MNQYEKYLMEELNDAWGFRYEDIKHLDKFPNEIAIGVLRSLLENACLGQNYAPIELAKAKISEINSEWLKTNLVEVAKSCIDFEDEWEYRRLVELVIEVIPELKNEILIMGEKADNNEVLEVVEDFKK